ncbi:ThiF family adenylyltransferase [Patescibacteria group bacterium]|nr:ThiF family adenylyltransferase [Patescibacteria group bacterium]MBU4141901.1 ThiF family adenylyltransferase [Patescibacteria group bacterium]
MINEDLFYQEAFKRNLGLLSAEEQKKIKKSKIAIVGLGGVGGVYLLSLIRVGVGNFHIADFDVFELVNINRQAGANINSLGETKTKTMKEMGREINPFVSIKIFPEGISKKNIDNFLEGVDLVIDGIDFFNIKDRLLLFRKAREHSIYALTSAPVGFGASLLTFAPKGMSFEEYFDIKEGMSEKEKLLSFGLGLTPSLIQRKYFRPSSVNFSKKETPSSVVGTLLCANLIACEAIKIILGKKIKSAPFSIHFDSYARKYKKTYFKKRIKKWLIKKIFLK